MKLRINTTITACILFLLTFTTFYFGMFSDVIAVSENYYNFQTNNVRDSDLYIGSGNETNIKNIINGNSFISTDTLNIDPNDNGGMLRGNLYAIADNVNIKSNIKYSETEKDEIGNPTITVDKFSTISGNVFIMANKFVIEPACKIDGDLYIFANEVELSQAAIISGNVFVFSDKFVLNSEINGSLYATVNSFDMKYFAFITRDLHLSAQEASLNGYIYRDSFITAKNIVTNDKFVNQKNFNLKDADNLTFSGEVKGNAIINAKNIKFKDKDNNNTLICKIAGDLTYSSKQEISVPEGVVGNNINFSKYVDSTSDSLFSNILHFVLNLITMLVCVFIIYLLIHKFMAKYLDKFSSIKLLDFLKYLGVGLGFLVLVPIIIILLFLSKIGNLLGLILLFIYILLLIVAKPIFIVSIAKLLNNKYLNKLSIYLLILIITIILSLIDLIPYLGFVISLLIEFIGFGIITKSLVCKK